MNLGHFPNFEIVDVAMAVSRWKIVEPWTELKSYQPWFLWSNWIKKAGPWGFPHSWKESGFHSTLCMIFSNKNAYSLFSLHQKIFLLCFMFCFFFIFESFLLEKTLESPLDSMIKPVNPKGNQPWIFIGRTDAEAPKLWPPDMKSQLIGKDPDARKDWRQKEKWVSEDEMVR